MSTKQGTLHMQQMQPHLPPCGFVRLPGVLAVIPVSRSTWWEGVKTGRFPAPVKLGTRTTAWRVEDIRSLIDSYPQVSIISPNEKRKPQPRASVVVTTAAKQ